MPPLSSLLFPCCAAEVVAGTACVCLLAAFEVRLLGFFVIVLLPVEISWTTSPRYFGLNVASYIDDT